MLPNIKVERNMDGGRDFRFQALAINQNPREIDPSTVTNDEHLWEYDKLNLPAESNIKNEITIEEFDFSQAKTQYEVKMEKLNIILLDSSPNNDQNKKNLNAGKDRNVADLIIKDEFTETETTFITKNQIDTAEESDASATITDGKRSSVSKYKFQNTKIHTNKIPYKKTRLTQNKHVDSQIRTHRDKKSFFCSHCEQLYTSKRNLVAHMRVHTGESKPFPCSHCDKKCFSKRDLVSHIRTHAGEKLFTCIHCEKAVSTKQGLVEHTRIHTGEKPYACIYCEKAFSRKHSLVDHIRIHTGERPYACIHCEKAFITKQALVEHTKIHTGERPFTCTHCDKAFIDKRSLDKHMPVHTGERPYACIHCDKAFPDKHRLKAHTRIHSDAKSCLKTKRV